MKEKIIFGAGGLLIGFAIGFIAGRFVNKKKEESAEFSQEEKEAVNDIIAKEEYAQASVPDPDPETVDLNKAYEDYKKLKGDKIEVLGNDPIDKMYPDISYEQKTLLYFIYDDLLVDEEGNAVDEEELIGNKLIRFGWYSSDEDHVWVRNNKTETDYEIQKFDCGYEDHFDHEFPDYPTDEDEDEDNDIEDEV